MAVLGGLRPAWVHSSRFKLNRAGLGRPTGSKKGPNMAPKMRPKTDQNRRQKRRQKKPLFKIVLGRSWSNLGAILGRFDLPNRALAKGGARFFENSCFRKSKVSRGNLGRTWANLGAKKAPKGSPRGSQDGAKKEKKNEVKLREV